MSETQLLALRHPETGQLGYLSVMGADGAHRALAIYLGNEALERFNRMHSDDPGTDQDGMRLVLESRQLQVSFGERKMLEKADLAEIKALGRKYRGEAWPQMRSYHPGLVAARVMEEEALWLAMAVEQLLVVAPRLRSEPDGTFRSHLDGPRVLCRSRSAEGGWVDEWVAIHLKAHEFPCPPCDAGLVARVRATDREADVQCLFTVLPTPVGKKGGRCVYPYLVMAVDEGSGVILGVEVMSVEQQTLEALIASVPDAFLRMFLNAGVRPRSLFCASLATAAMLHHPATVLGVEVECYERLPLLDQIVASMPL